MQTPAALPPPPPTPAEAPAQVTGITTEQGGNPIAVSVPMTGRDLRALRNRRENLSDQLISAQGRRQDIADDLKTADPAARAGLQDRLGVLDARIVQIERDIASTGRELTSVPAGLAAVSGADNVIRMNPNSDDGAFFGGMALGALIIAAPLMVRRIFGRAPRRQQAAIAGVQAEQFTRLEQSIDAIAVEVERISEGQRFTAKLMADSQHRMGRETVQRDV